MTIIELVSLLLVLSGLFGAINYFFLKLPQAIGIMVIALTGSIALLGLDALVPGLGIAGQAAETVKKLEFSDALLEGMLGLLLFAGALHVSLTDLKRQAVVVFLMATLGVALSTAIVGVGMSWITGMPLLVALVFGALISPTDPVAVLGVLKAANLRKALETQIAGESLFNDGVGYVVYLILVSLAFPVLAGGGHGEADAAGVGSLFLREAGGGAVLGVVLGWLVFRVMRHIDDPSLEVLITLALAFGGYELAVALHVSAPIMAVCAGLLIGDVGARHGMSEQTREYVEIFWTLIDEILNAVLFLLIGVEVFAIVFDVDDVLAALMAIPLALAARLAAVAVPVLMLRPFRDFAQGTVPIMTWGGLKGGISVALALALPDSDWKPTILTATYFVVIFSIIVQGLTVGRLASKVGREPELV